LTGSPPAEQTFTFFRVQTRPQVLDRLEAFDRLEAEEVDLDRASGRVLAQDAPAPEDLPPFDRSTVDGFAVRARETFGASESSPALFELAGEVAMGRPAEVEVRAGQAVKVWTGGVLPAGADAVVMLEYSRLLDRTSLELTRAVAPGANVIGRGEDAAEGQVLLRAGSELRAQELGLLAGLGLTRVQVVRRPRVAVVSTGNELVPAGERPGPGQIREINSHTLAALIIEAGAEPIWLGLVRDEPERLRAAVAEGLERAEVVLVSGGSSVGAADWTLRTFRSFDGAELLAHGVSISPGKPLILVRVGQKSLFGLPGHVASAMITFHLFVRPLLRGRLLGLSHEPDRPIQALLSRNLASAQGREDWVRVRLERTDQGWQAAPVLGPSGLISTLVKADGLIRVPLESEGLLAGSRVEVHLF